MKCSKICTNFPKHIYSAFFPLYLISTSLGLSPLGSKKKSGRREIFYSTFSIARTVIFAVVYTAILCYITYTFEPLNSALCRIRFYQNIFSSLLYFCEIVLGCASAKKTVEIFKNINEADEMLESLKASVSYKWVLSKNVHLVAPKFQTFQ